MNRLVPTCMLCCKSPLFNKITDNRLHFFSQYSIILPLTRCSAVGIWRKANRHGVSFADKFARMRFSFAARKRYANNCLITLLGKLTSVSKQLNYQHRGVAQLVARLVRDQEAMGSSPVTSTSQRLAMGHKKSKVQQTLLFCFLVLLRFCLRDEID